MRNFRDTAELDGTQYFEIIPGEYCGSCWNSDSVFIEEDVFSLLEGIFARHIPDYDHHSFMAMSEIQIGKIMLDLTLIQAAVETCPDKSTLRIILGLPERTRLVKELTWPQDRSHLANLIADLVLWFKRTATTCSTISLLGM